MHCEKIVVNSTETPDLHSQAIQENILNEQYLLRKEHVENLQEHLKATTSAVSLLEDEQ